MTTPYRQLTQCQRYQIEAGLRAKMSQVSIAKQVGVHPSTISREPRRNHSKTVYKAVSATDKSDARRAGARKFCKSFTWLGEHLEIWLKHGMSPEQISNRLKQEKPDQAVSHEWIYRFIATDKRNGGELYTYLRHCRKRYRKCYGSQDRRGQLQDRVSISERFIEVEKRDRLGGWKGDTMHGMGGNLFTLVERKSGYLNACLIKRRQVTRAINLRLTGHVVHTLTLDNCREFSGHEHIARKRDCQMYFADLYSSWQRGTNENTSGRLRQYFPKGSDFSKLTVGGSKPGGCTDKFTPAQTLGREDTV